MIRYNPSPDQITHSVLKLFCGWDNRWAAMVGMVILLMVQCRFNRDSFWFGLIMFEKYSSEA